jgi:hypothetical protein
MTPSARRSSGCCVSAGARVAIAALVALAACAACERAAPFDPEATARTILRECGRDSACIRERWRRDPRDFGLGLRAEVAGREPRTPLVVETTREIVSPALGEGACAVADGPTAVDYRTSVTPRASDQFPPALFRWDGYEAALVGHRQVVAAVSKARGDDAALWAEIEARPALEAACLRFRGKLDRCAPPPRAAFDSPP